MAAKLLESGFDHIFDHNWNQNFYCDSFKLIRFPGVAQRIERAVWDREAAGLNPATWTKTAVSKRKQRFF